MLDYSQQDWVRDEIMTSLWYALRRNGIEIPYPIRTLQVQRVRATFRVTSTDSEMSWGPFVKWISCEARRRAARDPRPESLRGRVRARRDHLPRG